MPPDRQLASAIVLGCHKIGWSIIRALGETGVKSIAVYYNNNENGRVSRYVAAAYRCPDPNVDEKGFIDFLIELSPRFSEGILIPSNDAMLLSISKYKETLSEKYKVAAPAWSIVEKCLIKKHTYELARTLGVRAPLTSVPSDATVAQAFAETIGYPCLVKPCVGHRFHNTFHAKMLKVENPAQLGEAFTRANREGHEVMVQEFIPGGDTHGVNYNAFWINGKPAIEITAEKVRLSPPQIGFPRVVKNIKIDRIIAPARSMLSALNFEGFACMEFKRDARSGEYVFMEINPRLNLSLLLSVKTGVNFAAILYRYYKEGIVPEAADDLPYRRRWYWIDTQKDIYETSKDIRRGTFSALDFIRPYLHRHVSVSMPISDVFPIVYQFYHRLFTR